MIYDFDVPANTLNKLQSEYRVSHQMMNQIHSYCLQLQEILK